MDKENIKVVVQSGYQQNMILQMERSATTLSHQEVNGRTLKSSNYYEEFVKSYKCKICFKLFTRKSHLNNHAKVHSNVKFECCI